MARGWFNLPCWNGLSEAQQDRLITWGNLPLGYEPEGECQEPAAVAIELPIDAAPGPRFLCLTCASEYLHISSQSDVLHSFLRGTLKP